MSVKDFVKQWSDVDGERANYQKDSTFCKVHQHVAGARKSWANRQSAYHAAVKTQKFMPSSLKTFSAGLYSR